LLVLAAAVVAAAGEEVWRQVEPAVAVAGAGLTLLTVICLRLNYLRLLSLRLALVALAASVQPQTTPTAQTAAMARQQPLARCLAHVLALED
jgi:hypothetical protein